jgi:hypothetical protein
MSVPPRKGPRVRVWLAHFSRANGSSAGSQEVNAVDRESAWAPGKRAAARLGFLCTDITGPEDDDDEE